MQQEDMLFQLLDGFEAAPASRVSVVEAVYTSGNIAAGGCALHRGRVVDEHPDVGRQSPLDRG